MKIRSLTVSDAEIMHNYYCHNTSHFKPWEPQRAPEFHSLSAWQQRVVDFNTAQVRGDAAYFIAVEGGLVIGHCSLTQIARGPFQACYMGYGVAESVEGQGVAYQLCQHTIYHAFHELHLHRIMANYVPHNNRSAKLLSRLGFVKEGVAKDYLQIAGKWQNHVLTSLTHPSNAAH